MKYRFRAIGITRSGWEGTTDRPPKVVAREIALLATANQAGLISGGMFLLLMDEVGSGYAEGDEFDVEIIKRRKK